MPKSVAEPWMVYWALDPPMLVGSLFLGWFTGSRMRSPTLGWRVARIASLVVGFGLMDTLQQLGARALVGHEVRLTEVTFFVGMAMGLVIARDQVGSGA